ncbi:cell division protease FtsH [Methylacidimicrobium cyclopophantes]|uniref:ATP-dependent zinc metalloprotease FtsH n=1 Tax=Methylacidimicrobium cyclopophantes TaxID=1041766 RepID=A0A5E6MJV2_9BACT|nr:ATP-dependent zinc metalloprotease FtsH [Methylacidimicrobium cyclopophantes]VVM08384.1 cell division protease FtsH [Methylacidimicrobium cyclopophantes]
MKNPLSPGNPFPLQKDGPQKKRPQGFFGSNWQLALQIFVALLLVWLWQESVQRATVTTIPYSAFLDKLAKKEIVECTITPDEILGKMVVPTPPKKEGEAKKESKVTLFRTVRVEDPNLVAELQNAHTIYASVRPSLLSQLIFSWVLPIAIFFLIWVGLSRWMTRGAGYSLLNVGKSRARLVAEEGTGVTFDDVAGCQEAKYELQEVVDFLKSPGRYRALGAKIPKGVLLIGPPGTGKTLLARAVAGEAHVAFFSLSGSEFVEMFVGVGASRVRDLFAQAKGRAPCIIFIDELDAIGRQRGVRIGMGHDEQEQTLNQLLVEMDGFDPNEGIILLAATNRPDILDRALLRPGRFDRHVVVDLPDAQGRLAILTVHSRGKPLAPAINLEEIAQATSGFSGADLANLMNEAALLAARRKAQQIEQADLFEALEKVIAGPERRSLQLAAEEKRRVAYHEVGHALVAAATPGADPVRKISIIPRGRAALGYTLQLNPAQQYLFTRTQLLAKLRCAMGGRAAEEIVYGEVSTGAENDLETATTLARQMVCLYGMSESVGLAHLIPSRPVPNEIPGLDGRAEYSGETARLVDQEVQRLLGNAYEEAKTILREERATLEAVTAELLKKETLGAEEFFALLPESAKKAAAAH